MKLVKKLLVGAAVAVAAISMMSCGWSLSSAFQKFVGADKDFISYDDANYDAGLGTWNIDEKNGNTEEWLRGAKLLFTKHSDMTGIVRFFGDNEVPSGPIGIIFNLTENKGKDSEGNKLPNYGTYNFCIAAVGENISNSEGDGTGYYVSYFANVVESEMGKKNFGVSDTKDSVDPTCYTPYEINYTKRGSTSDGIRNFTGNEKINNVLTTVIDIKEDQVTGDYTVKFYCGKDYNEKEYSVKAGAEPKDTVKISAATLGKTKAEQAYVGVYANIYRGMRMVGSLEILDLTHDAIIAD